VSARAAYDAAGTVLATGDRRYVLELREWEPVYAWRPVPARPSWPRR